MIRKKLSALEIAFGARATYGARSAQHRQRREVVFAGPVGVALRNDGIDSSCRGCGYVCCSCPPCATCGIEAYYHPLEPCAPAAPKQPACDRCGARTAAHCTLCDVCAAEPPKRGAARPFAVGATVECVRSCERIGLLHGKRYHVHDYETDSAGEVYVMVTDPMTGKVVNLGGWEPTRFKLVAEPPSARAEERDPYEAAGHPWARVGMRVRVRNDDCERIVIPRPKNCDRFDMTRVVFAKPIDGDDRGWTWAENHYWEHMPAPTAEPESDVAVLERCAALGITFVNSVTGGVIAGRVGERLATHTDRVQCARLALEAYHAKHGGAR